MSICKPQNRKRYANIEPSIFFVDDTFREFARTYRVSIFSLNRKSKFG